MAPPSNSDTKSSVLETDPSILAGIKLAHPEPGDEIVISGLSGSFPDSYNVYNFRDNLYNKMDLISMDHTRRWAIKHPEIPEGGGRIYNIEKFDASFFGIHYKQAEKIDPMGRMLLEKTFEAIVDAGLHINEIKGTKMGVFISSCFSEAENNWFYKQMQTDGLSIIGSIRSMLANRISHWLGVDGPSYIIDTACSSSLYAIEHAYRAIRTGQCEAAIVGGCNLCLHPFVTLQFARLGVLNKDGNCKCFDERADGYTRSEAIVVVILQKAKNSRRIYSRLVHAKTNCDGFKEEGITYPSRQMQTLLLKEFYKECKVNPNDIDYVEAHGTGTRAGDPEELGAIDNTFCGKDRKNDLWIGSVKSNIGHTEPASGLCSITKVILAMENGYLIPNINFNKPRDEMTALIDGRMKVITEKVKWNGGFAGVNSFGFGGANCHVLLESNSKEKINKGIPKDDIPRLVYVSGRTENAINYLIDDIANRPLDAEFLGLLHEVYKYDIPAHIFRGYAVLTKKKLICRDVAYYPYDNKPLWFVFSGLGSHWLGMGAQLMKISVFAATIEKIHKILLPKGLNITDIITKTDQSIYVKQTNVLVGIVTIQIAIVEILKTIDLKPDGLIAHSIGNLACAYMDDCLTLEQAILMAYYLGQAADQCKNINGLTISVDLNIEQLNKILIPGLEIACINSYNNCIVTGPLQKVHQFMNDIKKKGIHYEEINNICYHSSSANDIASTARNYLKNIVISSVKRSENWICNDKSNLLTSEFFSNILSDQINFQEVYDLVPDNAIALEISPHGILQNILKRSQLDDSIIVSIMTKNVDSSESLLTAVGRIYMAGCNLRIEKIYPEIQFPVSRGTPMVSPLIKWNHNHDWFVARFHIEDKINSGERAVPFSLSDDEQRYFAGHKIDGRVLFPATGYLSIVWDTVIIVCGHLYNELSIVFEDVKFLRAAHVPQDGRLLLLVVVQKVSGNFEVSEGGTVLVTGRIYLPEDIKKENLMLPISVRNNDIILNTRDVYKEFRLRGYNYSGLFRGIHSVDVTGTYGEIKWQDNWIAFIDTLLQLQIFQTDTRSLFVPTSIQRLSIDVEKHKEIIQNLNEDKIIPAYVYRHCKTIISGGVEIRDLKASAISRKKMLGEPVIETYKFYPNTIKTEELDLKQSTRIIIQHILENFCNLPKIKSTENLDDNYDETTELITPIVLSVLADVPLKQPDATILTSKAMEITGVTISNTKLVSETNNVFVIATNILKRPQLLHTTLTAIIKDGYIITRESLDLDLSTLDSLNIVNVIVDHKLENERILLLSQVQETKINNVIDISDPHFNCEWVQRLQNILKTDKCPLVYAQGDDTSGIIGFLNCLRREPGFEGVRGVFVMDENAPKFDLNSEFYSSELKKRSVINIYKNGQWGTYRHLLMNNIKTIPVEHGYVNVTVRGDLSSLRWLQGPLSTTTEMDVNRVLVYNYYSAMNFRDIMTATGRIAPEHFANSRFEQDCVQGLEYAGRLSDGRRVFGMINTLATATLISSDPQLMWEIPDHWSFEEAATVPVVYGTALYAFVAAGKIKKGMSVLIHSGTGGVGQAAINIALHYGCTVFTTVGSAEKREYIKKKWPQLKDNHIGNSRDCSFEQMIMIETNGRGVDLVLNSLAEEKLQASIRCLANGGRFLEIGKFDLSKDNPLLLNTFAKGISFHSIMLDTFFTTANQVKQIIYDLLMDGIKSGAVKPLERCIFNEYEIEEMFRYMASGKHMGKVLLKIREEEPDRWALPSSHLVQAVPRYFSTGDGSYIIVGGLGGFGLELVDWLILRGAKKFILTSRKGVTTGYQAMRINIWKSYCVDLIVSTEDVTTLNGCKKVIEQAQEELGPVEGIFNLAVVLKDQTFENQTTENFIISLTPKAIATKYLDQLSREMCPNLKQFVVFSSVSCGLGNIGQTNYGMANSVMERICENRHLDNLPALAIEWGAIGDVGLVAEMQEDNNELVIAGTLQQRVSNCLSLLDQFLNKNEPIISSMVVAEKRAGDASGDIIDVVLNILGVGNLKTVSTHSTLAELGMDSIMAVEIKQTLEREFEVFLTPQDIRSMTFAKLSEFVNQIKQGDKKDETPIKVDDIEISDMAMYFMMRALGNEINSNKTSIVMKTNASPSCTKQVILLPGIEGMASVLATIAQHLCVNAVCIQLGYKNEKKTVKEMSEYLLEQTLPYLSNLKDDGFTIVAYSYGTALAVELAILLEAKGAVGHVVLIDGSPEMVSQLVRQQFCNNTDVSFENSILNRIFTNLLDVDSHINFKTVYENLPTWEEKITAVLHYKQDNIDYSKEHFKNVLNGIYTRIKAMRDYTPEVIKLKSKLKLIKPKQATLIMEAEDMGLSKYSEEPVEISYVDGNHVLLVENLDVPREINKLFSSN